MIESNEGTLILTSLTFNSISTESVPLAEISGKSLVINNGSEFTFIVIIRSRSGSGGIVAVHITESVYSTYQPFLAPPDVGFCGSKNRENREAFCP